MAVPDAAITLVQMDGADILSLRRAPEDGPTTQLLISTNGRLPEALDSATNTPLPSLIILPRHDVTLRLLTLPSQDPDELVRMVHYDAADSVPYPIDEMEIRHQILCPLPSGESRVLVVMLRRAIVEERLVALRSAGGEAVDVVLSTSCLVAAATRYQPAGDIALLHADGAALELVVVRDGQLVFSRAITQSTPWDLDDPHCRESLTYEARELLGAYRRESADGLGVETVYISATRLSVVRLATLLEEALGKPCPPATFASELDRDEGPCPATFAGAYWLSQGEDPIPLSLAPPALARQRTMRRAEARIRQGALLVGVILIAAVVSFGQAWWQRHQLIQELEIERDAIAPRAEGIAAKQQGLRIISRQVERGASFLEMLAGLADAAPPSALNITRIQYDRAAGLDIWGRATSKDRVLKDFLGAIRRDATGNLAFFAQAHSLYETVGTERNRPIVNYQITIPIHEEDVNDATTPTR